MEIRSSTLIRFDPVWYVNIFSICDHVQILWIDLPNIVVPIFGCLSNWEWQYIYIYIWYKDSHFRIRSLTWTFTLWFFAWGFTVWNRINRSFEFVLPHRWLFLNYYYYYYLFFIWIWSTTMIVLMSINMFNLEFLILQMLVPLWSPFLDQQNISQKQ